MTAPKLTSDEISDLKQMLADGVPRPEIAEAFGVSVSSITYHAIRAGYATRGDAKVVEVAEDEAVTTSLPLLGLGQMPEWMERGLCAQTDPESFFPEKGGSTREAKKICTACPVAAECLDYALDNDERFGIWGGLSERERRTVKKALQADAGVAELPDNTSGKHNANKTHCVNGHRFTPDNTYQRPAGGRDCRKCLRAHQQKHRRTA